MNHYLCCSIHCLWCAITTDSFSRGRHCISYSSEFWTQSGFCSVLRLQVADIQSYHVLITSPFCCPVIICTVYVADVDEASKKEIKDILIQYDRTLLVADLRRCEPKKFGAPSWAQSTLPKIISLNWSHLCI